MYLCILIAFLASSMFKQAASLQVAPTWTTSSYVQAAEKNVITTKSNQNTSPVPSATFTFSFAFSSVPNLAYGITSYEGTRQFQTNLIMGLTQYSSNKTASCLHFNLKLVYSTNPTMSVYMPASTPRALLPFTRFGITIFYLKTWLCPNQTFFNSTNSMCVSCSIANCIECMYIDLCKTCNEAAGFLLDVTALPGKQCTLCPVSNCLNCSSITTCLTCNETNNYFLDPLGTQKCVICPIPHCISCLSLTKCSVCDEPNNYFTNPAPTNPSDQCILCSIPNCLNCFNLNSCQMCNQANNYFANVNSSSVEEACMLCSIPQCLQCISLNQCGTCNQSNGFVVNPVDKQCMHCPVPNCIECLNNMDCSLCDQNNNYFVSTSANNSGQCQLCSIPYCYKCANLTACSVCDEFDNFFLNPAWTSSSDQCIQCNIFQCISCFNLTTCLTCNSSDKYYLNTNATSALDQCLPCTIPFCIQCANLTDCLVCDSNLSYFYNPNYTSIADMCSLCTLSQCLQCLNLIQCSVCNQSNGYFLNSSTSLCQFCNISNCLQCSTLTTCLICDTNNLFFLTPTLSCQNLPPICGDNIFLPVQQCDDGNLNDNDGCSSMCTVENDFLCELNFIPGFFNSICYFVGEITLKVAYIEKIDNANQVEIVMEIGPPYLSFWNQVDFASMICLSNTTGFDNYSVKRNIDGTISIIANYNIDIHNMEITVNAEPARSGQAALSRALPAERTFPVVPTDNEAALFYDQSVYDMADIVSVISYGVGSLYLFTFLLGVFARKLIGVETMAVIQITYLSLLTLSSMNPCLRALANIWFVNGFNFFSLSKGHLLDPHTPLSVKGIYLYSRFFENYNFTFLLIIVPYIVSIICFLLSNTVFKKDKQRSQKLIRAARVCACQSAFNGVMFSGYIVSVSIALELKYGVKNMGDFIGVLSLAETGLLILIFFVYFILLIKVPQYFGQFSTQFIESQVQVQVREQQHKSPKFSKFLSKWYNFMILQRFIAGIGIVLLLPLDASLYYLISFFCFMLILIVIFRPYVTKWNNLRFGMNTIICIIIQVLLLLSAKIQSNNTFLPLIICLLLLICVIYNLLALIYSVWQSKKYAAQEKLKNELKQDESQTFRQIINQNMKNTTLLSPGKKLRLILTILRAFLKKLSPIMCNTSKISKRRQKLSFVQKNNKGKQPSS